MTDRPIEVSLDEETRGALADHLDARRADAERLDHDVQVTSFGGAGTTALCDHLTSRGVTLQRGPGHWPWKHRRRRPSPTDVPEGFRVIYLLGDPRDAVLSLFRRDYQLGHYQAVNERDPDPSAGRRLESLDRFLQAGVDDFALADHVDRWLAPDPGYPLLAIRYEALASNWPEIADFVEIAPEPPMAVLERASDWRSAPSWVRSRLDDMYGALARRIDALPSVWRVDDPSAS